MWSKLSIGHCLLQRWWLAVTQPNGQSWKKRPEILKRASQLICSIPAGQEKDKITAVYSWSSRIKHNYFKHSATFSVGCAGAGRRALCWCCKALGALAPWCTKTLHLWLVGTRHLALFLLILCYWILYVHQFPCCSVFLLVFFSVSCHFPAHCFVCGYWWHSDGVRFMSTHL